MTTRSAKRKTHAICMFEKLDFFDTSWAGVWHRRSEAPQGQRPSRFQVFADKQNTSGAARPERSGKAATASGQKMALFIGAL